MLDLAALALRNLARRNVRRTVLTILGIASATVVFCAVMVVPFAMDSVVAGADQSPRIAVTNRASVGRGLPAAYYGKVAALPGVVAVSRMVWFGGIYDDPKHVFPSMAIDADNPDVVWPEYALRRDLVDLFKRTRDGAVVGTATMKRFRWKIGDSVALKNAAIPLTLSFRIVGTINEGPDLTVFLFHRDYLDEALHRTGIVSMLWVRCRSVLEAPRIAAAVDEMFRNSSAETRSETEKIFLANMVSHFRPLANFVQAIGIGAMLAVALAVLNAAAMSLRERLNDIAIMKSLGFSAAEVMFGFVFESLVTAIGGAMLGTLIATALMEKARGFFPSLGPLLSFGLPTPVMVGGFAMAVMVGVLAGIAPALPTVRSRPQMILRKAV